jgi:hypothetical protein
MNSRKVFLLMLLGDAVGFGIGWLITRRAAGALLGLLIVAAATPLVLGAINSINRRRLMR